MIRIRDIVAWGWSPPGGTRDLRSLSDLFRPPFIPLPPCHDSFKPQPPAYFPAVVTHGRYAGTQTQAQEGSSPGVRRDPSEYPFQKNRGRDAYHSFPQVEKLRRDQVDKGCGSHSPFIPIGAIGFIPPAAFQPGHPSHSLEAGAKRSEPFSCGKSPPSTVFVNELTYI